MPSALRLAGAIVVFLILLVLIVSVLWPGKLTGVVLPVLVDVLQKGDD